MRNIQFSPGAWLEFLEWHKENKEIFEKINLLIKEVLREPFKGIGKPEPLKNNYKGCWSRRITQEHRFIYKVEKEAIVIISCKGHYE